MTFIEEVVFSGFVSKAVNNIVDVAWIKIKKAVKERNTKHQNVESQIYNVTVDVLNEISDNRYENNQDNIYDAAEVLLKSFKENEHESGYVHIKLCLQVLHLNVNENECMEFKTLLYKELGKDEYSELFHTILLLLLEQKNQYDHVVYEQLNQKLDEVGEKVDNLNRKFDEVKDNKKKNVIREENVKFQNDKKRDYIKNWNSRLFLHQNNDENPITLADVFIMPDYKLDTSSQKIGFSYDDTLDRTIEKFIKYDKTSTMLITGVPGIGKSTIISWIANKYKDFDNIIVLRFRDWEHEELEKGLLKSICILLECKKRDLERKIVVLDGFDEMKSLDIRENIVYQFLSDIKDFENFKCIITSRLSYIKPYYFHVILELRVFDIEKIKIFCKKITRHELINEEKIESNLDVLGIPVILYMAIMSNVDISENPTKPELYNRIFAEEGGIFDKFYCDGIGYDSGTQILRNIKNIKQYLKFLSETAFKMFEKRTLILPSEECQIPELEMERKKISILEFPIRYLFENSDSNIEFIHRSIYEYFVAEKIIGSIKKALEISENELASVFGEMFSKEILSSEIIEFLRYKIQENGLCEKFYGINKTFQLMLHDGMTYYTKCSLENIIMCEVKVFANMLEIIHLWENGLLNFDNTICNYIKCNTGISLNLDRLNLEGTELRGIFLKEASIRKINLKDADLRGITAERVVDAKGANLQGANLMGADLIEANLMGADLSYANLMGADLRGAILDEVKLQGANLQRVVLKRASLEKTNLQRANLEGTDLSMIDLRNTDFTEAIFDEEQIEYLRKRYDLEGCNVFIHTLNELISYKEYIKKK